EEIEFVIAWTVSSDQLGIERGAVAHEKQPLNRREQANAEFSPSQCQVPHVRIEARDSPLVHLTYMIAYARRHAARDIVALPDIQDAVGMVRVMTPGQSVDARGPRDFNPGESKRLSVIIRNGVRSPFERHHPSLQPSRITYFDVQHGVLPELWP